MVGGIFLIALAENLPPRPDTVTSWSKNQCGEGLKLVFVFYNAEFNR